MRVYIANLNKYNNGELVGAWFEPPIDFDNVKKCIDLNDQCEEYAIHDYELPFSLECEFVPIEELNRLCEMALELEGSPIYDELQEIQNCWFKDFDDLFEHKDDIIFHNDCHCMADVAQSYIEDSGLLDTVPINLHNYIDYDAFGRDMYIDGNFLITSNGIYEYCG